MINVGDKVRIKSWNEVVKSESYLGFTELGEIHIKCGSCDKCTSERIIYTKKMNKFANQVFEVEKIIGNCIRLKGLKENFHLEMIEKINSTNNIVYQIDKVLEELNRLQSNMPCRMEHIEDWVGDIIEMVNELKEMALQSSHTVKEVI